MGDQVTGGQSTGGASRSEGGQAASGDAGQAGEAAAGAGGDAVGGDGSAGVAAGGTADGGASAGGAAGGPGECNELVNDAPARNEWTVVSWILDTELTAPLEDLPGERDLHAIFISTGTDGQTDTVVSGKVSFREVSADPIRGSFDLVERYGDSPEQRATYAFQMEDPDTGRVELTWLCGDRLPFFENYVGAMSYIVDFQVVFTRDARGGEPEISRDYRTRDSF